MQTEEWHYILLPVKGTLQSSNLLDKANIDQQDNNGMTVCRRERNMETVGLCLNKGKGGDLHLPSRDGRNVLHYSVANLDSQVTQYLLN